MLMMLEDSPAGRLMERVWTRTPGTSVREFKGPGGYRPISRVGRSSRMRMRFVGVTGAEADDILGAKARYQIVLDCPSAGECAIGSLHWVIGLAVHFISP